MTPSRDPDEVEQTLLPDAPPKAPAAPPVPPAAETPRPIGATAPLSSPIIDLDETLPASARTDPFAFPVPIAVPPPAPPRAGETKADAGAEVVEPTLLPTSAPAPAVGPVGTAATEVDPAATLATPPIDPTAASGRASGPAPGSVPPAGPGARFGESPSATGTMVGRFALRGLHATGGLGEVFTARDTELNREVAVKRIKSKYADDTASRTRFLSEATLTARLDHPGVVPVFGLVNDVRGRPCYAMRFIRGETLKDEIERYHGVQKTEGGGQKTDKAEGTGGGAAPAPAPPEGTGGVPRSVAFRQLLSRFIATCQAIAYAHKKNIIHRDIKPANIMVGAFGETLVVDWGLAKSLDDGPDLDRLMKAQAEGGFRHDPDATDLPSHMTHAGTAVGTPAYMAPEQAAGDLAAVGPRADIYALGATLFVVLTGKAPVGGKNTVEVLDKVRRGSYETAAEVNPKCPKPLDAICRKAMALRIEDRYATALELAADVEKWLSDEPVSCYRDPLPARLARWARHHPTRVAASVSVLLASVVAAIAIAVVYQQGERAVRSEQQETAKALAQVQKERDNVTKQKELTEDALRRVTAQEQLTEEQRQRAVALGKVATGRYDSAVDAYNVLIRQIDERLENHVGTGALRQGLLTTATAGLQKLIDGGREGQYADRTLVAAYRQLGDVYQRLGNGGKAVEHFELAVKQARRVRVQVERPDLKGEPAERRAAARDLGLSLVRLAAALRVGKSDQALKTIDEAVELLAPLAADTGDPQAQADLAAAQVQRAKILMERGATRGALRDSELALEARRKLAPPKLTADAPTADIDRQRDFAASLDAVAELQLNTGHTNEGLETAAAALALRAELARLFPDHPEAPRELAAARARLGEAHFARGQMSAAVEQYQNGLTALNKLIEREPESAGGLTDLAAMYGRIGHAQIRLGEVEAALANTKTGVAGARKLLDADPGSARARRDLAAARERYGDALLAAGYSAAALEEYRESKKGLLTDEDPGSARVQLELARALEREGDAHMVKGNMAAALVPFEQSVKIREAAADRDKESAAAKRDLALGLYKVALAHCGMTQPGKAEPFAVRATDLFLGLARSDPGSAQAQRDVALAYGKWGQVLAAGGHSTGALLVWKDSLERCEKLALVDKRNTQALEDEAAAWERLAGFYAGLGSHARALAAASTAVKKWEVITAGVDVKTKAGRHRLALAMLRCGDINADVRQFAPAADWYKRAAEQAGTDPADPLLAPLAKQVAGRQEYLSAVEQGMRNVRAVEAFPVPVRIEALQTISKFALQLQEPTRAYVAALALSKLVKDPPDKFVTEKFAVARALAGCAAANRGDEKIKKEYADEAVAALKVAVAAGFRNAELLSEPEWEAVRSRTKELAVVQKGLEKLNEMKK